MKNFKKFLTILLCISMVLASSFSSFTSVVDENMTETTSKIEEQLKKDLGAEKAKELLTSKNENDNLSDITDDELLDTEKSENEEELENINPGDLILDENLEVEEDIEVDDSKNDNENDDVIKEESQIKEIEKENETEANDNVDEMVIEPSDLTYSEEIICR